MKALKIIAIYVKNKKSKVNPVHKKRNLGRKIRIARSVFGRHNELTNRQKWEILKLNRGLGQIVFYVGRMR